jgi:hypothetical protein
MILKLISFGNEDVVCFLGAVFQIIFCKHFSYLIEEPFREAFCFFVSGLVARRLYPNL